MRIKLPTLRFGFSALAIQLILLLSTTGCKGLEMDSRWTDSAITVDGRADDWSGLGTAYLEESEASVGFANDSTRLHILLRIRDPQTAAMIRRSGLTIWVDAEGGKRKDFRICYRGGPSPKELRPLRGGDVPPRGGREPEFMPSDSSRPVFTCFQEGRIVEMAIPPDGSLGPAAAFSQDQGLFTYEFSLPLQESTVRYYGVGAKPGDRIGVGAEWGGGGFDRGKMRERGGGGMGGLPPMGGGPGRGFPGGMGGGSRGGPGQRSEMPKQQEIWLKVDLAGAAGDHP